MEETSIVFVFRQHNTGSWNDKGKKVRKILSSEPLFTAKVLVWFAFASCHPVPRWCACFLAVTRTVRHLLLLLFISRILSLYLWAWWQAGDALLQRGLHGPTSPPTLSRSARCAYVNQLIASVCRKSPLSWLHLNKMVHQRSNTSVTRSYGVKIRIEIRGVKEALIRGEPRLGSNTRYKMSWMLTVEWRKVHILDRQLNVYIS